MEHQTLGRWGDCPIDPYWRLSDFWTQSSLSLIVYTWHEYWNLYISYSWQCMTERQFGLVYPCIRKPILQSYWFCWQFQQNLQSRHNVNCPATHWDQSWCVMFRKDISSFVFLFLCATNVPSLVMWLSQTKLDTVSNFSFKLDIADLFLK